MRRRAIVAFVMPMTLAACGIGVFGLEVGNGPDDTNEGGTTKLDASSSSGSSSGDGSNNNGDGGIVTDSASGGPKDSGSDGAAEQAACLAACPGSIGTCVAGVCTIRGTANQPQKVTCPGTVPCHVICDKNTDCINGVDCGSASSCVVDCIGDDTCKNTGVTCAGDSCDVTCSGTNSCKDKVSCTAKSHCGIQCTGKTSCDNNAPSCTTSGDCTITCGANGGGVTGACISGLECNAGTTCTVSCLGADCSKNVRLKATAPTTNVTCGDGTTCNNGVLVDGTDATVKCGTGGACAGQIQCKAKACHASCQSANRNLCCSNANPCQSTMGCNSINGSLSSCGG